MSQDRDADGDGRRDARLHAALLLLLCLPLFFAGLGGYDLDLKGEPREAITAWEMIHSGDWLLPRLNGEALPEKPLGFPWLVAASTLLFGERSEWAVRLPAALSAAGATLVVWAIGRRLLSARGGLLAGALFAGSVLAVNLGRSARTDMTLTLFVSLSMLLFLRLVGRPGADPPPPCPAVAALFWLSLAAGTLVKGPLGIVLPAVAGLSSLLAEGRPRALLRLRPWPFALLFVAGAGWWYAQGMLREGGDFGSWAVLQENWRMFLGESEVHAHGPLFYLPRLFVVALPWALLLPSAVARGFLGKGRRREEGFLVPLAWFASMFLLFSAGSAKRSDYLLPLLPAGALLVAGLALETEEVPGDRTLRRLFAAPAALLAVVGVAAAAVPVLLLAGFGEGLAARLGERVPADLVRSFLDRATARPAFLVLGAAALLAAGALPLLGARRGRPVRGLLAGAAAGAFVALSAASTVLPAVAGASSFRPFAEAIRLETPADAPLLQRDAFRFQVAFYAGRRLPALDAKGFDAFLADPGERRVLVTGATLAAIPEDRRRGVEEAARSRRPGDSRAEDLVLLRRAGARPGGR
jgi:hypothetical protein